jgi:hypothetical protein
MLKLSLLEIYFPMSLIDIMSYLITQIMRELKVCVPMFRTQHIPIWELAGNSNQSNIYHRTSIFLFCNVFSCNGGV